MNALYASIALSGVLIALTLSVVSLVLHWIRRTETPEYTALSSQIRALDAELVDLMDKIKHWRNRDSVRKARQGAEDKISEAADGAVEVPYKTQLRRRVLAASQPKDAS